MYSNLIALGIGLAIGLSPIGKTKFIRVIVSICTGG